VAIDLRAVTWLTTKWKNGRTDRQVTSALRIYFWKASIRAA